MIETVQAVPEGKHADIGDGRQLHYHEAGEGPVVLFIHGSGPGATGWSNFKGNYKVIADAGYRCIVPDLLGFGYSTTDDDVTYSWETVVEAFKSFCDALELQKVHLIGNSMGGGICLQLALDYPDLVESMVLMAPGAIADTDTYLKMPGIRKMLKIMYKSGVTEASIREVFQLQLYKPEHITEEIVQERFQVYALQAKNILGKIKVPDLSGRLSEIRCPVYGLWGEDDNFCPRSGIDTLMEHLDDVRVLRINHCGHWVMVEHEGVFNRTCIDFLNNG